jgi:hypothetical protein
MTVDLTTTNVLLGILATISVLEALVAIALMAAVFTLIRRVTLAIEGIEVRQVAPVTRRVNAILDDVKDVTACAKNAADRADRMTGWWRTFRGA